MSAIKKLAGQTAIYGLSSIAGRFLNYLLVPIFTRVFTDVEYGINAEFYAYISFLNIVLTHGMETAFFRFSQTNSNKNVFSTALISVLSAASIFLLIFGVFSEPIATLIGYQNFKEYVYLSALILFFDAISAIPFAMLRQQNKPLRFAVLKNFNIFINIGANLYLLILGPYLVNNYQITLPFYHPQLGITNIFIANLLASFLTTLLLLPELKIIKEGFDKQLWNKMLTYALPMLVVGFAGMINETLDRILIRALTPDKVLGMAYNGIYAANYKLSIIITLFIQAFKFAAEPFFFAHAKQTDKRDIYAQVMDYFILICLIIFLLVTLFLPQFKHFIGQDFHAGLKVVPILLVANICLGIYYNISIWYKLSDNTKKGAQISIIGAVITIIFNIILVPQFNYVGCAITTLVCYFTMMVLGYYWGTKYYPIPYNVKKFLVYSLLAAIIFVFNIFIGKWLMPSTNLQMVISAVLLLSFVTFAFFKEKPLNSFK